MKIEQASHGGSVTTQGVVWSCKCGARAHSEAAYVLPVDWTKMTLWRGTAKGTTLFEAIRCGVCSTGGTGRPVPVKQPLRLSEGSASALAALVKRK